MHLSHPCYSLLSYCFCCPNCRCRLGPPLWVAVVVSTSPPLLTPYGVELGVPFHLQRWASSSCRSRTTRCSRFRRRWKTHASSNVAEDVKCLLFLALSSVQPPPPGACFSIFGRTWPKRSLYMAKLKEMSILNTIKKETLHTSKSVVKYLSNNSALEFRYLISTLSQNYDFGTMSLIPK